MWSQQIIVALICTFLASQQVAAVVNNGQSAKAEESKKSISEDTDTNKPGGGNNDAADAAGASTDNQPNRREAPSPLGDNFGGVPITVVVDSYLPSGPSNVNLPVPTYGVPDQPTNNVVYPAPPPDIPPPVSLPSSNYGVPSIPGTYGLPTSTNYLPPPASSYGPPSVIFETVPLTPPKFLGGGRGVKPPHPQYGVPAKPLFNSKFPSKYPYKSNIGVHKHTKPFNSYGPPSGYFKDNYNPSKFNVKFNNIFTDTNAASHATFAGQTSHSGHTIQTQHSVPSPVYAVPNGIYGIPNVAVQTQTHSDNLNFISTNGQGLSDNYGGSDIRIEILQSNSGHGGQGISTQYGPPGGDVLGPTKPHYGPPQPSPHPKPPHPGAPAPPTPPDIKYDGWQPIPGLVSKVPSNSYGAPPSDHHALGGANNDLLIPPPIAQDNHYESSSSYGSTNYYGGSQRGVSDSYGAPLNTVTGSGGIVSSSGEEVHGQHLSHSGSIDIDIGHGGNNGKGIGIEIYPSGSGSLGGQTQTHTHSSSGFNLQIGDTYGAPPLNSYSPTGPYPISQSHNFGASSLGLGSYNSHLHNKYNSHKALSSNSGRGLIPPSGVYGSSPSGHYGTPLFTKAPHGPSPLNALKINPPKHPVIHRDPVPPGLFESITKQGSHKHSHGQSSHHGFGSSYLPPSVTNYAPPLPSTLYSLPNAHSSVSFQNVALGSSSAGLLHENFNLNIDGASSLPLNSYDAPLNIVDGSYNLPQSQTHLHSHLGGELVGLDLSHPTLTIDLTHNNHGKNSFSLPPDCSLQKGHSLPSLSYGVPSANGYTASLSSLTTNIGGGHQNNLLSVSQYGTPEVKSEQFEDVSYQVSESEDSHHDYDLSTAHSQKVGAEVNLLKNESQGKSYGKSVADSFGPHSELLQSQAIDFNNIPLQGALGSYTLQIQSADGSQGEVSHDQVLNEGLLQSILAAIEQPEKNKGQPIIQLQKSLEQQNFITNDSIPAVVGKLADQQIEHSSPVQYVVEPSNEVLTDVNEKIAEEKEDEDTNYSLGEEDNAIALYFSNNQRSKNETVEGNTEYKDRKDESDKDNVRNSH